MVNLYFNQKVFAVVKYFRLNNLYLFTNFQYKPYYHLSKISILKIDFLKFIIVNFLLRPENQFHFIKVFHYLAHCLLLNFFYLIKSFLI